MYESARPEYSLPLDGHVYKIQLTTEVLFNIESALRRNILYVAIDCMNLKVSEVCEVLALLIQSTKLDIKANEVADIIHHKIGFGSDEYQILLLHLNAIFTVALSRPSDRQKKAEALGESIAKYSLSLGENIKSSA